MTRAMGGSMISKARQTRGPHGRAKRVNPRKARIWEEQNRMAPTSRLVTAFFALFAMMAASGTALAQKQGGILRQYIIDSPASMSIHEETTVVAERPMMAVMNNLVLFDHHVAQNSAAP